MDTGTENLVNYASRSGLWLWMRDDYIKPFPKRSESKLHK